MLGSLSVSPVLPVNDALSQDRDNLRSESKLTSVNHLQYKYSVCKFFIMILAM